MAQTSMFWGKNLLLYGCVNPAQTWRWVKGWEEDQNRNKKTLHRCVIYFMAALLLKRLRGVGGQADGFVNFTHMRIFSLVAECESLNRLFKLVDQNLCFQEIMLLLFVQSEGFLEEKALWDGQFKRVPGM